MGMSIDKCIEVLEYLKTQNSQLKSLDIAIDTMRKYQQLQADYEARLKADLKAILVELQLEFEENTVRWYVGRVDGKSDDVVLMETINDIIQQRINAWEGNNEQREKETPENI